MARDSASWGRQAQPLSDCRTARTMFMLRQEYTLTQHGFAGQYSGLGRRPPKSFTAPSNSTTRQRYPFEFDFRVRISTSAAAAVRYAVKNPVKKPRCCIREAPTLAFGAIDDGWCVETTYVSVSPAQVYGQVHLVGPHSDLAHLDRLRFYESKGSAPLCIC